MGSACAWPPAMTGEPSSETAIASFVTPRGTFSYHLEIADSPPEQQRGLMFRETMAPDFGMIFVFGEDRQRTFWMRNTLIPLDMVFVRADGVVDSVQPMATPRTDDPRPSDGPARYVIELVGGEAARVGIGPGVRVELANLPSAP